MSTFLDETYSDKEKFKQIVTQYFLQCDINHDPLTLPSLAEHCKCFVGDFLNYPKDGPLFRIVGHACLKCENYLIKGMLDQSIPKSVADILLKLYFPNKKKDEKQEGPSIADLLDTL